MYQDYASRINLFADFFARLKTIFFCKNKVEENVNDSRYWLVEIFYIAIIDIRSM